MKLAKTCFGAIALAVLLIGSPASAQFSGYFGGYYAPANWSSDVYNNASYQNNAFVYQGGVPNSLQIDGAVNSQQQSGIPTLPVSIIDYTIVLSGTGLQPVAFNYSFTGLADGYDSAQLIYNNGSGLQVVTSLSTSVNGTVQSYSNDTLFQGGDTIGFRVQSNNDNIADTLTISVIPEPSTFSLLGLGAGAFLWRLRRRQS